MAGEWGEARLGELCDFRAGAVFKPALQGQASGEFPFVKVSDMNLPANAVRIQDANNWVSAADLRELRAKPFPPGTVVFAKIGEALRQNRLRQVARETVVDNNMMGAVPRIDRIDPQFFYYALSRFDFSDIAQGTALPYLTVSSLSGLTLDLPPASEQRAIAHILGTLDDKIELNRRMNETLEAMARALFKSWFVDFDPVRAKADGIDPQLPKSIASLFPVRFVDSELGEIPEGWSASPLGGICRRVAMGPFGSDIKTDNFVESGVPIVRGVNLKDGFVDDCFVFLTEEKANELRNANAFPGDIVITHRGTLGQVGLVPFNSRFPRYVVSQSQMLLTIDEGCSLPRYVYMYLRSSGGQQALLANMSQTGVPAIARPTTSVKAIRLVSPSKPVLEAFGNLVEPLCRRQDQAISDTRTLAALRDALLPKLVSGELRIRDAEGLLERTPC